MHAHTQQHVQFSTEHRRKMTVLLFKSTALDELILKENDIFIDFTQLDFPQGFNRI